MAATAPPATQPVEIPVTGTCFIPDVFMDNVQRLMAALDWARVYTRSQQHPLCEIELRAASEAARALAEQCDEFAGKARKLADQTNPTP